ncbi:unnamed protein product [Rotaria sordida]|uniref:EF-hand domain-containing protein n=1 Tax=Rotaria sordida TaxID=392033 RepID=A0A815CJI5_9BILA|nr:unnamed protein product [Rotaria sordida]CAF1035920.1 unnamed protein product [Rotaria sordida]CAF1281157.1 unnamed protein product [Rotaria sordida]CAF3826747.1 unnamed protein product [Rotaria sordida]CAF3842854.1 unnamed protein product [Rotaria sordida]
MAAYDPDDLKILFSLFDANRDGNIAKEEIKELVSFIAGEKAKENDVAKVMQLIDINKDNVISIDEFEVLITKYFPMVPLGARSIFNTFDLNHDGFVDKNEFNQVIKDKAELLNERNIDFFKKILTRDDSDKISYQQFIDSSIQHYRSYIANRDD